MLNIIAKKHPETLPKLYRTILDVRRTAKLVGCQGACRELASRRAKTSAVPVSRLRHQDLGHRRFGLMQLRTLDPEQFMTILLATLESLLPIHAQPEVSTMSLGQLALKGFEIANQVSAAILRRTGRLLAFITLLAE